MGPLNLHLNTREKEKIRDPKNRKYLTHHSWFEHGEDHMDKNVKNLWSWEWTLTNSKTIACCHESQTYETDAAEKKNIYQSAHISKRWVDDCLQKPVLTSLVKPTILIVSWREFVWEETSQGKCEPVSAGERGKWEWEEVAGRGVLQL